MIGQSGDDGRRCLQRTVNLAEVVDANVRTHHRFVVFPFLAKPNGQSRRDSLMDLMVEDLSTVYRGQWSIMNRRTQESPPAPVVHCPAWTTRRPLSTLPASHRQRFRRTRIAVSVFFGVLTVALCVLWVRSYWRWDHLVDMPRTPCFDVRQRNCGTCKSLRSATVQVRWRCDSRRARSFVARVTRSKSHWERSNSWIRWPIGYSAAVAGHCRTPCHHFPPLLPPHPAHRHDAGGRRAGAGRLGGVRSRFSGPRVGHSERTRGRK